MRRFAAQEHIFDKAFEGVMASSWSSFMAHTKARIISRHFAGQEHMSDEAFQAFQGVVGNSWSGCYALVLV